LGATIRAGSKRSPSGFASWLTAAGAAGALALIPAAAASGSQTAAGSLSRSATGDGHAVVAGTISTAAGGVGGPGKATTVALPDPCGVSFAAGSVYLGDDADIRTMSQAGQLTTPAGTGTAGPLGDGGPAVRASFDGACGVLADRSRNLVIADTRHSRVRVVAAATGTFYGRAMTAGDIYTVAGNGFDGFAGDGGPAASAELNYPGWAAVDAAGNLLIADTMNNRIRVVAASTGTFYGRAMTAGDIYTVAGGGAHLGDGGPATSARLLEPGNVSVDGAGNVLIADSRHSRIRVVAASTGSFYGRAMTAGDIYTVAGDGTYGFSGDGGPAKSAALTQPSVVAVDGRGNLVFADIYNSRIRVVAVATGTFYGQAMTAGDIYTIAGDGTAGFAGDGGPATSAELWLPRGVAVDQAGNVLIGDSVNNRVRLVAASTGRFYGQAMTAGDIYTVAGNGTPRFSGAAGPATRAELSQPMATAVDAAGNMVIADSFNSRIRVVAASTGTFYGRAMTAGDIYVVAGNGTDGFAGDGGPATAAELYRPSGLGIDRAGNLLIGDTYNDRIRVVAERTGTFYGQAMTAGDIYTVAGNGQEGFSGDGGPATSAELSSPYGAVEDTNGNLVFADTGNDRFRVVASRTGTFYGRAMTAGDIYTVAGGGFGLGDGGPATQASLQPGGLAVSAAGNLLAADSMNERIRVIATSTGTFYGQHMTAGDIYSVAGNGTGAFAGDGGPATAAEINFPQDVSLDGAGNLLIADTGNGRIRVVAEHTGTFYGQPMTSGDIYTVAGNGTFTFSGDGGPATKAGFAYPWVVTADHAGDLLIADAFNNRIRMVAG
jgi:trimeric autotransporter adhesin